jgi:hypothetical protein
MLSKSDIEFCQWLGEARYKDKKTNSNYRPLSENSAMIGVAGELLFSLRTGYPVDTEIRPKGDGGIDFKTPLGTIDVKTHRRASTNGLLVESGKVKAFIFVLAEYFDEPPAVKLLGFAEACTVRNHPALPPNKHNISNHKVPIPILETMEKLLTWLQDIDPGPGKTVVQMTDKEFHRRCWAQDAVKRWGSLTPPPARSLQEIWREAGLLGDPAPGPGLISEKPLK